MTSKTHVLITLDFDNKNDLENDHEHIIYDVPSEKTEQAKNAIQDAYQEWLSDSINSIEDLIEKQFHKNGIPFQTQSYEEIILTMYDV